MQQLSDLRYISYIRRSTVDVTRQTRFSINTDMRLHAEEVLIALIGLLHFRIAFAFLVLRRTGRVDDGGINNRSLAQRQSSFSQVVVDGFQNTRRQLMLIQQAPKTHNCCVFQDRSAELQSSKLAHRSSLVQRLFHDRVAQRDAVLQQVNAHHCFQWI